jgi:hypothetical protein
MLFASIAAAMCHTTSGGLASLGLRSQLSASPATRTLTDKSFEHGREVGLCVKPYGQCDVQEAVRGLQKEPFSGSDPLQKNEIMRPAAGRKTELRCKMRTR